MKPKLRPIRTRAQCRQAGDSFIGFSASSLPHMPFRRRLRVAWMILRGRDLSQYDVGCGYLTAQEAAAMFEHAHRDPVIQQAFGDDEVQP